MKVIISAGGTGGHIYPALAIIDKIKEKDKKADILYIGTTERMEKDIIPNHNINYIGLQVKGFYDKKILKNILVLIYFIRAIFKMKKIIKEFKPDVVIGVGGYVTAPVIYAASKLGVKTIIHEQNSEYGTTNKFLSKYANIIATSFEKMDIDYDEAVYTGNPVGDSSKDLKFDKKELGLSKDKKLVMIVLGSLGSIVAGNKIKEALPDFKDKDYEVVFITGKDYYDEFKDIKVPKNVFILPYIESMRKTFNDVDILVSRSGASTISEITAYNLPTIFIPSPYVSHNHQYKNAMDLVNKEAALIIEEKDLNKETLINTIDNLLNNKKQYNKIKANLSKIYIPNSKEKIYDLIIKLVKENKS